MKNYKLLILLLFSCILFAQERIIDGNERPENYSPQKGDYLTNNLLDDFEGVFIWKNDNGKEILITLIKKKFYYEIADFYTDMLFGSIEYKRNNKIIIQKKVIESKDKISTSDTKTSPYQIMGGVVTSQSVELSINDEEKNKHIVGIFTKLENGKYLLKLKELRDNTIIRPGERGKESGFTLPEEMILIKLK